MDECSDFMPTFRWRKDDNPTKHLCEFYELVHKWEIHHEDVLLKMFMILLAGYAHEWYHSLPPASISSLDKFHADFDRLCQKFYSYEFVSHSYCKEYNDCVQNIEDSNVDCEDE